MEIDSTPWWLALVTALCFGFLARRAGRSWVLWGASGALLALVTATLVLGLGQATTIPFSDQERRLAQTKWTVAVVLITIVLGWLFTLGLHQHHRVLWRIVKPSPGPAPANPPVTK